MQIVTKLSHNDTDELVWLVVTHFYLKSRTQFVSAASLFVYKNIPKLRILYWNILLSLQWGWCKCGIPVEFPSSFIGCHWTDLHISTFCRRPMAIKVECMIKSCYLNLRTDCVSIFSRPQSLSMQRPILNMLTKCQQSWKVIQCKKRVKCSYTCHHPASAGCFPPRTLLASVQVPSRWRTPRPSQTSSSGSSLGWASPRWRWGWACQGRAWGCRQCCSTAGPTWFWIQSFLWLQIDTLIKNENPHVSKQMGRQGSARLNLKSILKKPFTSRLLTLPGYWAASLFRT